MTEKKESPSSVLFSERRDGATRTHDRAGDTRLTSDLPTITNSLSSAISSALTT